MKKILAVLCALCISLPMAAELIGSIDMTPTWIYLYNPQGKKYQTLSVSSAGEVVGYSSTFFVCRKGSWYYFFNSDGKKYNTMSVSTVGDVIGVAGDTFTSRNGGWIYTWNRDGKKINTRSAR